MKKLYVDDIRNAPDDTWTAARTVTAAISAIDIFFFDVISLDHDISHQVTMGGLSRPYPCDETFTPVAQYIAAKYKHSSDKPRIIIHTSNPAGAIRMAGHLIGFDVETKESYAANRLEMEIK